MRDEAMAILMGASAVVAFTHTFAPDHWVPFTMIGRARGWTPWKVAWVTFAAGLGHVGSSVVLGIVAIGLGWVLDKATGIEAWRGPVALWTLIGFGFAYALWGLKDIRHGHAHHRLPESATARKSIAVWALIIIFVLGPCEPLIPLVFKAYEHGAVGVAAVAGVFGLITVSQMVILSTLAFLGLSFAWTERLDRFTHTIAGATIAATGLMVLILKI
jgi:nickel/cobalt transporter (NicO) family protein